MTPNLSLKPNHSLTSASNQVISHYEVRDINGNRYCHCGSQKDAENVVSIHPGYSYVIIYMSIPQVVDVSSVSLTPDKELPDQKILPESQLEPFITNLHD